eukprot:4056673-Prymnesium_polylepis.1
MPLRAPRCTALAADELAWSKGRTKTAARKGNVARAAEQALMPDTQAAAFDWQEEARLVPASTPALTPFLVANASAFERNWGPFLMQVALRDAWWRPAPVFKGKLHAAVERIFASGGGSGGGGGGGGCLAMHVRRGDVCRTSWRRCPKLEAYLAPAREIGRRYGLRAFFVATDDDEVLRALHTPQPTDPWERVLSQRGINRS